MTIAEKIKHDSAYALNFYKEGAFWVGYEQSAWWLWKHKGYRAKKKWVKSLGTEVVKAGFPQPAVPEIMQLAAATNPVDPTNDRHWALTLQLPIDAEKWSSWKASLQTGSAAGADAATSCCALREAVKNFSLHEKSPLDAFLFLHSWKQKLN